ncbi:MAG: hypothetical protein ABR999_10635 [Methanoregula sp.]|uniref:hypothetical protein n=1 Tax=Methanoregula sp. TaxID=2052170 RepID=UPI003D153450
MPQKPFIFLSPRVDCGSGNFQPRLDTSAFLNRSAHIFSGRIFRGVKTKKILWVSRHSPQPAQIEALNKAFPNDEIKIVRHKGAVWEGSHLLKLVKKGQYDEVVLVAPPDVFAYVVSYGIPVIRAVMARGKGRSYEFLRFERVIEAKFRTVPLLEDKIR